MTHQELWSAINNLANKLNLSCSGLAKHAGLDSTTFNKSKRINRDGSPRWPSTYSIAKILDAAGIGLAEFAKLLPHDTPSHYKR